VAGTSAPTSAAAAPDDLSLRKISGLFDTDLPKTEPQGRIKFIFHPHVGDFTRRSYLRVPLGLRWGVNDHVEINATVEAYVQHGLHHGEPGTEAPGNGVGDVELGAKYAFQTWLKPDFDASVGINLRFPVGTPPIDLTDGYNHYAPYLVLSRASPSVRGLTYFYSGTVDVMEKSSVAGSFRKNDPHSSSLTAETGFVLDRYPYHYALEAGYQTTALVGKDNQQFVFIRPSFAWDLPRRLTFNSRGRWLFGISFKITEGPDGTRIDSGGKIRGEFNLRRWLGSEKPAAPAAP